MLPVYAYQKRAAVGGGAVANVTALSIDQIDTAGGDFLVVEVDGNGLAATGVTIGGTAVASFELVSNTEIRVQTPAKAAGTHAVEITTAGGAGSTMNVEAWSPAGEDLALFFDRGNYQDVTLGTLPGRASAGASGGRDLVQATVANRPADRSQDVDFDGAAHRLASTLSLDNFVGAACSFAAIVEMDNLAADDGGHDVQPKVFCDSLSYLNLSVSASGARFTVFDGVGRETAYSALTRGKLTLIRGKWDGTHIFCATDDNAFGAGVACAGPSNFTGALRVGSNWNSTSFLDGRIRSLVVSEQNLSDATFTKIQKWAKNSRGVSTDTKPEIKRCESDVFDSAGGDRLVVHGRQLGGATDVRLGTTAATIVREPFAGTPSFDGGDFLTLGSTIATVLGSTAYSISLLFMPKDTALSGGSFQHLLKETNGYFELLVNTSGFVSFGQLNAPASLSSQAVTANKVVVGEWNRIDLRWTGAAIQIRLNGGAWANGNNAIDSIGGGGTFLLGCRVSTDGFFSGRMSDLLIFKDDSLTDSEFDDVCRYHNETCGLALGHAARSSFNPASITSMSVWLTRTWYSVGSWADQSGNAFDFVQATAANQPAVADSDALICTTPAVAAGTYPIAVKTAAGWGALANAIESATFASIFGSANILADWRADVGVTESGGAVTVVADQSGQGDTNRNLTNPATSPDYTASDPDYGGRATITAIAGADRRLVTGVWDQTYSNGHTIIVWGHHDGATDGSGYFTYQSNGNRNSIYVNANNRWHIDIGAAEISSGDVQTTHKPRSCVAATVDATGVLYVEGGTSSLALGDQTIGDEALTVGTWSSGGLAGRAWNRIAIVDGGITQRKFRKACRLKDSYLGQVAA